MSSGNFFIRSDNKYIRVNTGEIRYIEAVQNYVRIVTTKKTWMILMTMKQMEQELPAAEFCRVHRSYIVNLRHITSFDSDTMLLEEDIIPLSDHYKPGLMKKIRVLVCEIRERACN